MSGPSSSFPNLQGNPLEPQDYASLEARWINRELAEAAMLRRVDSVTGAEIVGRRGGDFAGILIPYFLPGEAHVRDYRLRRDHPDFERASDGTLRQRRKYLSPPGRGGMLYFPPGIAPELLTDVDVPTILTEGEFKGLALWRLAWYSRSDADEKPSFLVLAIPGVWNWRGIVGKTYDADGVRVDVTGPIPDIERILWLGRRVIILFDADLETKLDVSVARDQLTRELQSRGAEVAWFPWPKGVPSQLKGIDDYLAERGPAEVLSLLAKARVVANKTKRGTVELRSGGSSQDWKWGLLIANSGEPKVLLANAITALRHAPEWTGVLAYDEFALKTVMQKPAPWPGADPAKPWGDNEDRLTTDWLQHQGICVPLEVAGQGVQTVAMDHRFHPVRDYLDALAWDGVPRLDQWLTTYLGVTDSPYARAVGARWLISAVARIYSPGVKADCCLILEGSQGLQKSTALRKLSEPWFTDELGELGSKDAAMQLRGAWVVELSELEAALRADVPRTKAFVSRQFDRFRPPYGKHVIEAPRQCVFAATVNPDEYLRDETGARRFWPVACGQIDVASLARDRDQLWAEARDRFRAGEKWWLDTPELEAQAQEEQADRYQEDPWHDTVAAYIADQPTVSVPEILLGPLGKKIENITQADKNRVARILLAEGWERFKGPRRSSDNPRRPWLYRRKQGVAVHLRAEDTTETS
jgi:predicted P-loop ATPase